MSHTDLNAGEQMEHVLYEKDRKKLISDLADRIIVKNFMDGRLDLFTK